jgi:hypothetical protein
MTADRARGSSQFANQPEPRHRPVTVDRARRHAELLGGFAHGPPATTAISAIIVSIGHCRNCNVSSNSREIRL